MTETTMMMDMAILSVAQGDTDTNTRIYWDAILTAVLEDRGITLADLTPWDVNA